MNWVAYGPRALLFRFAECASDAAFHRSRAIAAELEKLPPPGLVEFTTAFTTVLLEFNPQITPRPTVLAPQLLARFQAALVTEMFPGSIKEIPVSYDGEDVGRVAAAARVNIGDIGELHSRPVYKVYMLGFSPGFPYMGDLDPRLHTPRLASPRTKVRPGSVAIGGEHTGIYTVESAGGWNIIGHTSVKIFDPTRAAADGRDKAMFFLSPGDRVKFVPIKMR